jgi:uncharacterized membrane protein
MDYKLLFYSGFILIVLDFIYLHINRKWYEDETERSQGSPLKLKWQGVMVRYVAQILGLYLFVLQNNGSVLQGVIYGFIIYANYIGTNYATITVFDERLAIADFIKGGSIMGLTTLLVQKMYY